MSFPRSVSLWVMLGLVGWVMSSPAAAQVQINSSGRPISGGLVSITTAVSAPVSNVFSASGEDAPAPEEEYTFVFSHYEWALSPTNSVASISPTEGTSTTFSALSPSPLRSWYSLGVTAMYDKYDADLNLVAQNVPGGSASVTIRLTVMEVELQYQNDEAYVGCGKDTDPITLTAIKRPAELENEAYAWSVVSGPGAGYFSPDNASSTSFYGTSRGKATAEVRMSADGAACADRKDVHVIEINDLQGPVPPQYMMVVEGAGYAVPFSDPAGDLIGVYISPVLDGLYPYAWETDFTARVDHVSGTVTISLFRPGPYTVKIDRVTADGIATSSFVKIWNDCDWLGGDGDKEKDNTTDRRKRPAPPADLVLISTAPNDSVLRRARVLYPDHKPMSSVADACTTIQTFYIQNGERPFSLLIIDHGNEKPWQGFGCGRTWALGKVLDHTVLTIENVVQFHNACRGRVSYIMFFGCNVAKTQEGENWIQAMADNTLAVVSAFRCKNYLYYDPHDPTVYYDHDDVPNPICTKVPDLPELEE